METFLAVGQVSQVNKGHRFRTPPLYEQKRHEDD